MYYAIRHKNNGMLLRFNEYQDEYLTTYELNIMGSAVWVTDNINNALGVFEIGDHGYSYNKDVPWSVFPNSEIEIVTLDIAGTV